MVVGSKNEVKSYYLKKQFEAIKKFTYQRLIIQTESENPEEKC